jgi:hypothetical protein
MSATTDRLDQLAAQTAPLPWPVEDFYSMPGDQFQLLFALSQAWPLLRSEVAELEATTRTLSAQNAQLHAEHARIVSNNTVLGRMLEQAKAKLESDATAHAGIVEELTAERNALLKTVHQQPERTALAEKVCESFTTTKSGSGGAHGWIDGTALDAWKAARA